MKKIEFSKGYTVTDCGVVLSTNFHRESREREMVFDTSSKYARVTIRVDGKSKRFSVHRIVAEAFIDNPDNKPCVNHIDGNKLNNNSDNLEWCTHKENTKHAFDTGLSVGMKGEAHPMYGKKGEAHHNFGYVHPSYKKRDKQSSKKIAQVDDNGVVVCEFASARRASESIADNVKSGYVLIARAAKNKTKAYGFGWIYI